MVRVRGRRTAEALTPVLVLLLAVGMAGCASDVSSSSADSEEPARDSGTSPKDDTDTTVELPEVDPANFVDTIDNPYLPLTPGTTFHYVGISDGVEETVTVEVTEETKEILGVETIVVRDVVTIDGELVEDTLDWFAQDRDGNVWYFGEDSKDFEDGELVSTQGSWEAGHDGAEAGVIMLADPTEGEVYQQENYPGEAEDMGEILSLSGHASVPYGDFDPVLVTRDWNPLESGTLENKHYAPGVGMVLETVPDGDERLELVDITEP